MAWFRTGAGAAVGLAFVVVMTAGCGGSTASPKSGGSGSGEANDKGPAEVGKGAPDLSIQTVNGKGQITRDSLSGKVAIVDFWATWCGPCKQSFPKLEELAKQNQGKVQVVGISVDDKADGVADFAKSNGATFAIGWDDGHAIANRWKVDSMPTTYVLDSAGTVRYIHAGYHDGEADVIAKELATLAAEPVTPAKAKSDDSASSGSGSGSGSSDSADSAKDTAKDPPKDPPAAAAGGDDDKTDDAAPPKKKPGKKKPGAKKPAGKTPPKKKPAAAPTQ